MALVGLCHKIELHTFHPRELEADLKVNFEPFGIAVAIYPVRTRFLFEYLHPLARPRIVPLPRPKGPPIAVEADKVLRFGCLEGDFRVTANRAVYDPQSGSTPSAFGDNGSSAERLALVLNADEILCLAKNDDIGAAATSVMSRENAAAIVVKNGAAGAHVFERDASPRHVPAYPTRSVYKIGSGDVFSATFAHAWLSLELSATEAADVASRRTADYVEAPAFPLSSLPSDRVPATTVCRPRRILIACTETGTTDRWLLEEVTKGLRSLGAVVVRTETSWGNCTPSEHNRDFDLVLAVLHDTSRAVMDVRVELARAKPIVAFANNSEILEKIQDLGVIATDDLCSALYLTQWVLI
jgi:hypothetical protein